VGYNSNGLGATPEQIARNIVYGGMSRVGFATGGMLGGDSGDTQKVEFFKNPNEKVIIARPDQFADVRPGSTGTSSSATSDGRPIVIQHIHNWNSSAPPSRDSMAAVDRQTELSTRRALRTVNGR